MCSYTLGISLDKVASFIIYWVLGLFRRFFSLHKITRNQVTATPQGGKYEREAYVHLPLCAGREESEHTRFAKTVQLERSTIELPKVNVKFFVYVIDEIQLFL